MKYRNIQFTIVVFRQLLNKSKKQRGRPKKQTKYLSAKVNSNNEGARVNEENTRFDVIRHEDNGEVVMTQEMVQDIQKQFDTLCERM